MPVMNHPVLFLDFDGVLSKGQTGDFRHMPAFEDWLRRWPQVRVVISSTWRLEMSLAGLRDQFAPDVRDRVLGGTPEVHGARLKRQAECMEWRDSECHVGPFAVIDDNGHDFEVAYPFLVETTRHGLQPHHLEACERILGLTA